MKEKSSEDLVKDIANLLNIKYKKKFVAFGLLGSMATGDQTEFSDIEAICILKGKNIDKDLHFVYNNKYIHIWYGDLDGIIQGCKEINIDWPAEIGHFKIIKIIEGDKSIIKKIHNEINKISQKKLNRCIENNLPAILEDRDKFKSIRSRAGMNLYEVNSIKFHLVNKTNSLIALLNKSPIAGSGYRSFKWIYKLRKKPKNYAKDINAIIKEDNLDKLIILVDKFVSNFIKFMNKNKINFKEFDNLRKVEL
ncbi:MAG: hypothetical protein WC533_04985 [Candidatus Pacearchaeota archaeon]